MPAPVTRNLAQTLLAAGLVSATVLPATAGGIFEVIHPEVEEGQFEVELLNTVALGSVEDGEERSVHEIAFGGGLTPWWKPILAFEIANPVGESPVVEAVEVENVFILFGGHDHDEDGHGEHGVDERGAYTIGFYAAGEFPTDSDESVGFSFGPIGEFSIGPATVIGNLFLDVPTSSETPGISYAVAAMYPVSGTFSVGVEAHGGVEELFGNDTPDLSDQEHYVGPALYAEFETGDGLVIEPRVAALFGLTSASVDAALSVNLEFKF